MVSSSFFATVLDIFLLIASAMLQGLLYRRCLHGQWNYSFQNQLLMFVL